MQVKNFKPCKYLNLYHYISKLKLAPLYTAFLSKMHVQYTAKVLKMLGAISIATHSVVR